MELIPAHFYNLGKPPTLNTCTRDVFDEDFKLSEQQLFEIAISMASVAAHLHERGIMHGDLYAHNVLVDDIIQHYKQPPSRAECRNLNIKQ